MVLLDGRCGGRLDPDGVQQLLHVVRSQRKTAAGKHRPCSRSAELWLLGYGSCLAGGNSLKVHRSGALFCFLDCYYALSYRPKVGTSFLFSAGEDCFRGLFIEVSLALVGVASPA